MKKSKKHIRKIFFLRERLLKAGIEKDERTIFKVILLTVSVIITVLILLMSFYYNRNPSFDFNYYLLYLLAVVFPLLLILTIYIFFYTYLDLRIYQRKTEVEEVLPDFLQLVAANIRAGMTIDRAMWYSIRPRFGILAKEMEVVAKESMAGKSLIEALNNLINKFDSVILKRSISLIIEGIMSGGKLGDLLNRLAISIQEIQVRRKEMAANITTYVIFISFASACAAPILFALSTELIKIINIIGRSIDIPNTYGSFAFTFKSASVMETDFMWFAIAYLLITSIFSSMIIASIKKGSIKGGVKYIFMFIFVTIPLYFFLKWILSIFFGYFIAF